MTKMGDQRVLEYFRKYRRMYDIEDLKRKVLQVGYTQKDIDDALFILGKESGFGNQHGIEGRGQNQGQRGFDSRVGGFGSGAGNFGRGTGRFEEKDNFGMAGISNPPFEKKEDVKIEDIRISQEQLKKKSVGLKIAGSAGILGMLLFLSGIFFLNPTGQMLLLAGSIFCVLFYIGFIILGKRYNQRLVKVMGWVLLFFFLILTGIQIFEFVLPDSMNFALTDIVGNEFNFRLIGASLESIDFTTQIILSVIFLLWVILSVLMGIAILKLKPNVSFAKSTGIFVIVGALTTFAGIGILLLVVARILEVVMFFRD